MLSEQEQRALRARVRTAWQESTRLHRPVCAWLTRELRGVDPGALFAASARGERFSWEEPEAGLRLVASGAASILTGTGSQRLRVVRERAEDLFAASASLPTVALDGPVLTGGFAFSPAPAGDVWSGFPPARFVLPEHLVVWRAGAAQHTIAVLVRPETDGDDLVGAVALRWRALVERAASATRSPRTEAQGAPENEASATFYVRTDPSPARFRVLVDRARQAIHTGRFEKVVLARCCTLSRAGGFDPQPVFEALRERNPSCFRIALGIGDATLLAATPERLLRVVGGELCTSALAGTAARGRTPEDDARLGLRLRESKKEQEEHAFVVRALRRSLAAYCSELRAPEAPELLRLDALQHLHTPMAGTLRADVPHSILDLAAQVHPSPAVGGEPRSAALAWLDANERALRGWYAGALGWISPRGEGDLAVALRTILLRATTARLHAGAGIVESSTADDELEETRLKLRGGLAALMDL